MRSSGRFNRRRAAEIRSRHRAAKEEREREKFIELRMGMLRMGVMGFNPYTQQAKPGEAAEQAYARFFEVQRLLISAGDACGAAVAASAFVEVEAPRGILATVLGWLPWR